MRNTGDRVATFVFQPFAFPSQEVLIVWAANSIIET